MPRRRRITKQNHGGRSVSFTRWFILFSILIFGFIAFVLVKVSTLEKFIYLNKTEAGDAEIIIVDTKNDSVIKYLIPAETEFEASNDYGNYRLKSLWILSEKESQKGRLVADTVTKNYSLPIYYWKDDKNSNLSIYQKVKVFFTNKNNLGYEFEIKNKKIPDSILINFVDSYFLENDLKVEIEDLTGTQNVIDKVSRIIEVLGGKVSNNSKGYDEELDCEIIGKSDKLITIVNSIFDCTAETDKSLNTDLKIRLGAKFTSRF